MAHIIILGRNYSTSLSAIRSLGKVGHIVDLIYVAFRKDGNVVSCSKYLSDYTEISQDSDLLEAIRLKISKEKSILFPTDDYSAELIDRNREELSKNFLMPFMDNGNLNQQIEYYMSKSVQQEIAKKCGMKIAKTWIVKLSDNVSIPDDLLFPCFVKPLISADGGKGDIGKCDSPELLYEKLQKLYAKGREEVMIQEYLDISQEYVINGVCHNQTVIIPGVIRKTKVAKKNQGVTISGVLESNCCLPSTVIDSITKILQSFRYTGAFDFELNVVNGEFYFGEVNLRIGGPSYIYTLCGANIPDLTVCALQGANIHVSEKVSYGKSFYNDKVLWEDYFGNFISRNDVKKYRRNSDFSLTLDNDDPLPGKMYYRKLPIRALKNLVKKLIKK